MKTYTQGIADAANLIHTELRGLEDNPVLARAVRGLYNKVNDLLERQGWQLPEGKLTYEHVATIDVAVVPTPHTQTARELFAQNRENLEQVLEDMATLERRTLEDAARITGLTAEIETLGAQIKDLRNELETSRQRLAA